MSEPHYSWAWRIYAEAHAVEPASVELTDPGIQDVDSLLGEMLAEQVATLSGLLGLPPDDERDDADIAQAITDLAAERDRLRAELQADRPPPRHSRRTP